MVRPVTWSPNWVAGRFTISTTRGPGFVTFSAPGEIDTIVETQY